MAFATVVPKQARSAGTHATAWLSVPVGSTVVTLRGLQDQADLNDAALVIEFTIEGSFDGGTTPFPLLSNAWSGGVPSRDGLTHPASQSISTNPMPTTMRLSAVLPRAMSIGLQADASS